ncbi:MAG: hypothetical protein U1F43_03255 [Myxococcota bacterium]
MAALVIPDVDLDGDGETKSLVDGISVGFFLKTTSATVSGVTSCPGP